MRRKYQNLNPSGSLDESIAGLNRLMVKEEATRFLLSVRPKEPVPETYLEILGRVIEVMQEEAGVEEAWILSKSKVRPKTVNQLLKELASDPESLDAWQV